MAAIQRVDGETPPTPQLVRAEEAGGPLRRGGDEVTPQGDEPQSLREVPETQFS